MTTPRATPAAETPLCDEPEFTAVLEGLVADAACSRWSKSHRVEHRLVTASPLGATDMVNATQAALPDQTALTHSPEVDRRDHTAHG